MWGVVQLDDKDIHVWKAHTKKTLISGFDAVNEAVLNPKP